jgi:hypothetical protein
VLPRPLLVAFVLCSLCGPIAPAEPARAESRELSEARQMFVEGVTHARAGHWDLALAAFEAAYAIAPQPSVLFNLAAAQKRTGKLLASNANFRRFVNSDDSTISRTQQRVAQRELADVEARIPRLRIEIEGLKDGDRILLDQVRIYPEELGRELWVDPGVHRVRVDRPHGDQQVRTIAVSEGQVRVLAFQMP